MFANILESIYDVLTKPTFALYRITRNGTYREAIIVLIINALISSITQYGLSGDILSSVLFSFIGSLFLLYIASAFLHISAIILGGDGDIRGLLRALPYAVFPNNLLALAAILALFGRGGETLIGTLGLGVSIWVFVLQVITVAQNYTLNTFRAVLTVVFPFLCFIALIILLFFLAFFAITQGIISNPDILNNIEQIEGVPF